MNNQVKLIDAEKLLEWMEKSPDAEGFWQEGNMHTGNTAFDNLTDAINEGKFDPDTPPVPTIKPGDKVRYSQYGCGDVKKISAWVWFSDGPEYKAITPDDLEVVE